MPGVRRPADRIAAEYRPGLPPVQQADYARRALHIAAVQIAQMCGPGFNPAETGDLARKLIDAALAESDGSSDPARSADLYVDALARLEHPEDVAGMIVPYAPPGATLPGGPASSSPSGRGPAPGKAL